MEMKEVMICVPPSQRKENYVLGLHWNASVRKKDATHVGIVLLKNAHLAVVRVMNNQQQLILIHLFKVTKIPPVKERLCDLHVSLMHRIHFQ